MEDELYFTYGDRDEREIVDDRPKRPLTAEETLALLASRYLGALDDIVQCEQEAGCLDDYAEGAKSVYVETLQILQEWEKKNEYGLDFEIESVYHVK